jgi:carbamoyltransferase
VSAVLGVSCFFHDAAAALTLDGVVVAAAEEERFSRRKHDARLPRRAIRYCLESAGLEGGGVDYVVFYEKPLRKLRRVVATLAATAPRSSAAFAAAARAWRDERLWIRASLAEAAGVPAERVLFVDHHTSHAASTFLASPFEEAAVLTVDGVGEWSTTTIAAASGTFDGIGDTTIRLLRSQSFPHSLGLFYSAFTAYLGFEVNDGEYKVMGMAAYGAPRFEEAVRRTLRGYDDGSFWLDLDYFAFHHSLSDSFAPALEELLGELARDPSEPFATRSADPDAPGELVRRGEFYADVAASVQKVTEDTVVALAHEAHRLTGSRNLCLAGGVALNGLANARALRETPFERIFIPPAPGDAGGAIGAALYVEHVLLGRPRSYVMRHAYLGKSWSTDEIRVALDGASASYRIIDDEERLCETLAGELERGRVVGWFQGRSEWGPRALGNRSILADPRDRAMTRRINEKIKYREPFRPFAPAILERDVASYVDGMEAAQLPARFMLLVLPLAESRREQIPAVDHFGTARLQSVTPDANPRFYRLLESFERRTDVPVLLNTSFNLRGEPIVNSPSDALSTFARSDLDLLVLGPCVVSR